MCTGPHGWLVKHGLITSTVSIGHGCSSHREEEDFLVADAQAEAVRPGDEPYCKVRKGIQRGGGSGWSQDSGARSEGLPLAKSGAV